MRNLMNPSWWVGVIVSTFFTMCVMYVMKKVTAKVDIPVVSDVVQGV